MVTARWGASLAAAGLMLGGLVVSASAQTGDKFMPNYSSTLEKVQEILTFKPKQTGIDFSKPSADEQKSCSAKVIVSSDKVVGWLLLDAQNRPLRRFYAADGKNFDTSSYYKDGIEIYREIDSNVNGKVDQYRWLNGAGSKWGVDANEDGTIDSWRMISGEEAAQEAYQAVAARDFNRLRTLLISDEEIRALKLAEGHASRIKEGLAQAQTKFQELCGKATNLNAQSEFVRAESAVPYCVPANASTGPAQDVLRFSSRSILYQTASKSHEWLHTGEMILVGQAWRLAEVPGINDVIDGPNPPANAPTANPELEKLLKVLPELDKNQPSWPGAPGKYPEVVSYITKRVPLLEQIYAKTTDNKEKETWMRQILDNLCTGHQANKGDGTLLARLGLYKNQLAQAAPDSAIAGYAHYREMWARYSFALAEGSDPKTQQSWNDELEKFVKAYPKAEDAPDALLQLAMNSEFGGPDKQQEAKKYYGLIASNFPEHSLAPKASGAVKRLDLNGKAMQLAAPTLQGGATFDLAKLNGKVVAVYYWASNCKACIGDFAVMRQLQTANAAKGFEVVTINLDETQAAAMSFLSNNQLSGNHLFQATEQAKGLESPLATQYGIVGLPTIILVGRDGRVIDRSIQINELDDAIKKAL